MKKTLFAFMALATAYAVTSCQSEEELSPQPTDPQTDRLMVITGKATATINGKTIDVNWVQLWENGPKFAEYNVGVTDGKAENYGGYYTWGGTYKNGNGIDWSDDHNTGSVALSGTYDTATKLWGSKWRMPTEEELEALVNDKNCTCTWTTQNSVAGLLCTGRGAYSSNSVFLPAAGYYDFGNVIGQGFNGRYWSSTPHGSYRACSLSFRSGSQFVGLNGRDSGCSVRAVLAEEWALPLL